MEYGKFRIGDLFDIVKGKRLTKADMLPGGIAFIGSTQSNNGLTARVGNPGHIHPAGTITVTYNGSVGQVFYQAEEFRASDDVNVLYPKFDMSEPVALYCCAALRRAGKIYAYTHKWTKDKMANDSIYLPLLSSGEPDFAAMAERIEELEAERIEELEAYLIAAGLDDYELTEDDRKVLSLSPIRASHEASGPADAAVVREEVSEFRIGDLFEGKTGDVDLQSRDIDGKGERFVNSGVQNQGIKGRTSRPARVFPAGTITIDFFGNAYLRDFEFKMATHNHVFALIEKVDIPHDAKLYIAAALNKLSAMHSFNNMLTWTVLKGVKVMLPITDSGKPDFDYMATYIRVQQKMAIADAVRLKDEIIAETRRVVA